jgi:hypothetical protein
MISGKKFLFQKTLERSVNQYFFKYFFGGFFSICAYNIQHWFICRPSDSTVPTDAGIEPRTVATCALLSDDPDPR